MITKLQRKWAPNTWDLPFLCWQKVLWNYVTKDLYLLKIPGLVKWQTPAGKVWNVWNYSYIDHQHDCKVFCWFFSVYFIEWGNYIQNLFQAVIEVMKSGLKNWEWSTSFHSHFPVHGTLWLTVLKNYELPLRITVFLNSLYWVHEGFCFSLFFFLIVYKFF